MENNLSHELDIEAFIVDIESAASQQAYAQRHIHPLVSLARTHDSDPVAMAPQELPLLEDDLLPFDTWE